VTQVFGDQSNVADENGQEIIEIMCDSTGQTAKGFQSCTALHAGSQLPAGGGIPEYSGKTGLPGAVGQRYEITGNGQAVTGGKTKLQFDSGQTITLECGLQLSPIIRLRQPAIEPRRLEVAIIAPGQPSPSKGVGPANSTIGGDQKATDNATGFQQRKRRWTRANDPGGERI
jgi:hypothetical protein